MSIKLSGIYGCSKSRLLDSRSSTSDLPLPYPSPDPQTQPEQASKCMIGEAKGKVVMKFSTYKELYCVSLKNNACI